MKLNRDQSRKVRHLRIRNKMKKGTNECPRLNVFRSNKHFYAQIIDDENHKTLLGISTLNLENNTKVNIEAVKILGTMIAKKALEQNITTVVFDRGGYLFHGKVAAFATSARENGLKF